MFCWLFSFQTWIEHYTLRRHWNENKRIQSIPSCKTNQIVLKPVKFVLWVKLISCELRIRCTKQARSSLERIRKFTRLITPGRLITHNLGLAGAWTSQGLRRRNQSALRRDTYAICSRFIGLLGKELSLKPELKFRSNRGPHSKI